MEKLFYELRPLMFLALAVYAVFLHPARSTMLTASGWVLAIACGAIIYSRYTYRHAHPQTIRRRK